MQNIVWKIVLIFVVLGFCAYEIYPPEENIRLGRDLQGGTSLIYLVNVPKDGDKQAALAQVITVLKERVDPRGVLEISMQPLGADRIEIVMPLPNEEVVQLRAQYEQARDQLLEMAEIRIAELDEALRFGQVVERFGGQAGSERAAQMQRLQDAYNTLTTARGELTAAREAGVTGPDLIRLEQTVAEAQIEYEDLRDEVLRTSLEEARFIRTLGLPTDPVAQEDAQGNVIRDERGNPVMGPSPREEALRGLKEEFPHLAEQIDTVVAAYDAYQSKRRTLDDPEDLMRLLRGAGVLQFHIAVNPSQPEGVNIAELRNQLQQAGPENTDSPVARWFPINDIKQWAKTPEELAAIEVDPAGYFAARGLTAAQHEGQIYVLLYTTSAKSMTHSEDSQWTIEQTGITVDQLGRPAISFRLDDQGGVLMSRLTGAHVGQPMAIVLDGQVYSAPNLQSRIGKNGIIVGNFSKAEQEYLLRVLAAGALESRLSDQPIAINTLGPSLGADNLRKGLTACVLSLIATAAIMLGYYFMAGLVANIALVFNVVMIFGIMAMIDGTFTLPGLAGIALSVAMAVDANVLIYERIREELVNNKEDLKTAIHLGYNKALSAIVDGNLTNLIVCIVLMYTATTEVKGFALTMTIGIAATLFTALFVTRVIYTLYVEGLKATSLPMLPTVFPAVHRALEPSINWISKRHVFIGISIAACVLSIVMVYSRGVEMLDTEFRGGLAMTMQTRLVGAGDERLLLGRAEVEREIREIGEQAGPDDPVLYELRNASVLTVGEMTADFRASRFQIKVASPPGIQEAETITDRVVDAIVKKFGDRLEVTPALNFRGAGDSDHTPYTYPVEYDTLGQNIGRPELTQSVARYRGGVAIVIEDISPPVTVSSAKARIDRLRDQPDFSRTRGRDVQVIGIDPVDPNDLTKGYTSLAVLTYDRDFNQLLVDVDIWDRELAATEWQLVSTALSRGSSLQEVNSFSPAVAKTLAANATVAVVLSLIGMLVYIWVRFGSLRYSLSAVAALTNNVIICLGALALTHWLAGTGLGRILLIEEFRIDLNVIAALLTIIGYSLNDTIVILDRIRENRGKRLIVTPKIVNDSINQTFSRTILTGGTTVAAAVILFVLGGTGIQPFAYTFLIGLLAGTYSSVTVAAPLTVQRPPTGGLEAVSERDAQRRSDTTTVAPASA